MRIRSRIGAIAAMATVAVATIVTVPAQAVQAPTAADSARTATVAGDVSAARTMYWCNTLDKMKCAVVRGEFNRYYNVSPLYRTYGRTCPGGCGDSYYFYYW